MPRDRANDTPKPARAVEFRRAAAKLCEAARELRRHLDDPLWAKKHPPHRGAGGRADIVDAAQRLADVVEEAPPPQNPS